MVDVTRCIGCRKGVALFTKDENGYKHVDLFATQARGSEYRCGNSDVIGEYLNETPRGTFLPNYVLGPQLEFQDFWWQDIVTVLFSTLETVTAVNEHIKTIIDLPNALLEQKVLTLAESKGVSINSYDYPDLLKWK